MLTRTSQKSSSTRLSRILSPTNLLYLCILLATGLRFYHLGFRSLHFDELRTAKYGIGNLPLSLLHREHNSSILTCLLVYVSLYFGGESDFVIHFPSALAGILGTVFVYKSAETLFGKKEGLFSAFLLAISQFHICYSQDARYYSISTCLSLASLYFLLRFLQQGKWKSIVGYVIAMSLYINHHPTSLFVLIIEFIYAFVILATNFVWGSETKRDCLVRAGAFCAGLSIIILSSAIHSNSLIKIIKPVVNSFIKVSGPVQESLVSGVVTDGQSTRAAISLLEVMDAFVTSRALHWVYLFTGVVGLLACVIKSYWDRILLLILWIGLPFILLRFIQVGHFFHPRYLIFILPVFLAISAKGLIVIIEGGINKTELGVIGYTLVLLLISIPVCLSLQSYYWGASTLTDWEGVSESLKEQSLPGDLIVISPSIEGKGVLTHYYADEIAARNQELVDLGAIVSRPDKLFPTFENRDVWWVWYIDEDTSGQWWSEHNYHVHRFDGLILLHKKNLSASETKLETIKIVERLMDSWKMERISPDRTARLLARNHFILASLYASEGVVDRTRYHAALVQEHFEEVMRKQSSSSLNLGVMHGFIPFAVDIMDEGIMEWAHRMLVQYPSNAWPHAILGMIYMNMDHPVKAIPEYQKAIEINSHDYNLHIQLSQAYQRIQAYDKTVDELERTILMDRNNWVGYEHLYQLYMSQEQPNLALELLEDKVQLHPILPAIEALGSVYQKTGQIDRAIDTYKQAAGVYPKSAWPRLALGRVYAKVGNVDKALAEYKAAILLEPHNREPYEELASLFVNLSKKEQAFDMFNQAIANNLFSVWPHLSLSRLYYQEQMIPEAASERRIANRLEPGNTEVDSLAQQMNWNLGLNLNSATTAAETSDLVRWVGYSWARPYPYDQSVLVAKSDMVVDETIRPGQIYLHPFSTTANTFVTFDVENNSYTLLHIGYGLADRVAGKSNGVGYTIEASLDGGYSYNPLFQTVVTDTRWHSQTVSLIPYWGKDITFRLNVDAMENENYDWLQAVVKLLPELHMWDLSENLQDVSVVARNNELSWQNTGFWTNDGSQLVNQSELTVQSEVKSNQIHFHPADNQADTQIIFTISDNRYAVLKTAYALADGAVAHSNGVGYRLDISTDGGKSYTRFLDTNVTENIWDMRTIDLTRDLHCDMLVRLTVSSLGDYNHDWLQITLGLLPPQDQGTLVNKGRCHEPVAIGKREE